MADRTVSINGGVISVVLGPGQIKYYKPPNSNTLNGIQVLNGPKSNISYTTHKQDNVDMIDNIVRIINSAGTIDSYGRIEVIYNRTWYSICKIGSDENVAKLACENLG